MRTLNRNAMAAIFRMVAAIILLCMLFFMYGCSPQKQMNKAVNRVLANREALDKVGKEWEKLNPCANEYKEGDWTEIDPVDTSMYAGKPGMLVRPGQGWLLWDGRGTLLNPAFVADSTNYFRGRYKLPEQPEIFIPAHEKFIVYKGRQYWYPQRRFLRVDTVLDRRALDSLRSRISQKDVHIASIEGQLKQSQADTEAEKKRGDKWFWWFIGSIALLIVSHIIRSRFRL